MTIHCCTALTLLVALRVAAQTQPTVTFQSTAQLVVETVSVKDKAGNPVEGLTASDFTITEDGVPQAIRFFEFQKLKDVPSGEPAKEVEQQRPRPLERFP